MQRRQRNGKPQRKGPKRSQNISQHFTAPCHYRRFTVVVHLSSFVEDSETPSLVAFTEKLLQYSHWRFVDTRPVVQSRLHNHFADILNSQLTCTTTDDKRWSYPETLIFKSMVSLADSPFKFPLLSLSRFLDPLVLAFGVVKLLGSASKTTSVAAEQRALLVFPTRNSI